MGTIRHLVDLYWGNIGQRLLWLLLTTIIATAILAELWLLWTTPREALLWVWMRRLHPASMGWKAFAALVLLPLAAMACFFRLPAGRSRLKTRYVIRRSQTARTQSEYNPLAIQSALSEELGVLQVRSRQDTDSTNDVKVTIAPITVPLAWLSSMFWHILTGVRTVVIEATLDDSGKPLRLIARCADLSAVSTVCETQPPSKGLDQAIRDVALQLISRLDPWVRMELDEKFGNFDDVLARLRREPGAFGRDLHLARLFMDSHRDHLAREQLRGLSHDYFPLPWRRRAIRELASEIDIKVGDYVSARTALTALILQGDKPWRFGAKSRRAKRNLWTLLGSCDRDDGRYADALRSYEFAQASAMSELTRLTGQPADATLNDCIGVSAVRPSEELALVLDELDRLHEARATCLRLSGGNPAPLYKQQLALVRAGVAFSLEPNWRVTMRRAQITKYLARWERAHKRIGAAIEYFDTAAELYGQAISEEEESNRYRDWNFNARADLAWCECGRFECHRAVIRLQELPSLTDQPISNLRSILSLAVRLPDSDCVRFEGILDRLLAPSGGVETDRLIVRAAEILTLGILDLMPAHEVDDTLQRLRNPIASSEPQTKDDRISRIVRESCILDGLAERESNRRRHVLQAFSGMLAVASRHGCGSEIERVREVLRRELEVGKSLANGGAFFSDLGASPHHQAEQAYGYACLHAIQSEGSDEEVDTAVRFLRSAIDLSGNGTTRSGIIGRARTDPDFDLIRRQPKVKALLSNGRHGFVNSTAASR